MRGRTEGRTRLRGLRLLAPAILAAAVVAALPGTAQPASPGANGKIAFVGADRNIWLMDADGSNQAKLTSSTGGFPAWSPDGQKIAFSIQDIYVMDADGSSVTQLTSNIGTASNPAWSPDGHKIAFQNIQTGRLEIYVMDADGSNQTQLTHNITSVSEDPVWSPDGQKIAFMSGFDIYVMDADGSNVTQLTHSSGEPNAYPDWSPDGQRIVFASSRDGGPFQIYVMDADGSNQTRVTNSAVDDIEPVWSPDGSKIAFTSIVSHDHDSEVYEVYVMDADGSGRRQLTTTGGMRPDWQPLVGQVRTATVQQPIDPDGSSVFNAGRGVLPVKFTLALDGVPTCTLPPATIALTQLSGASSGAVNESEYTMPADSGSDFRIDDCQYVYNLSLTSLSAGSYQAEIKIDGQAVGSATFELR